MTRILAMVRSCRLPALLSVLATTLFLPEATQAQSKAPTLRFGKVTFRRVTVHKRFQGFLEYLRAQGFQVAPVRTTTDEKQMLTWIREGKVNLVFESAYGAIRIMDRTPVRPLLVREKDGVKSYCSTLFVRRDSSVEKLEDLIGKVVVFEDETSTSSYLLPKNLLLAKGLELVPSRKAIPGKVAYWFTKNDERSKRLVAKGVLAEAGGISPNKLADQKRFRKVGPASPEVPRQLLLGRKDLDTERLVRVLLAMRKDPKAKKALQTFLTPTGFSRFPEEAGTYVDTKVRRTLGMVRPKSLPAGPKR